MSFIKHRRRRKGYLKAASVSISPRGLMLNSRCLHEYFPDLLGAGHNTHGSVELYFNAKELAIGISRVPASTEDSYSINTYRPSSPVGIIPATEFIKDNNVNQIVESAGRKNFFIEKDETGMLLIRLRN